MGEFDVGENIQANQDRPIAAATAVWAFLLERERERQMSARLQCAGTREWMSLFGRAQLCAA